ncbi:MAG: type II secretion system protein [bacterium]|nr:type II secretion system protein [bacterium]
MKKKFCSFQEKGSTLVEIILVILMVGFLALLIANLPSSLSSINKSRHTSEAKDIVSRQIENLRKQGFTNLNLTDGETAFPDTDLSNLSSGSAVYKVENCPSEVCQQSEEAKKVTVKVSWNESGDAKSVELVTIVSEGGL